MAGGGDGLGLIPLQEVVVGIGALVVALGVGVDAVVEAVHFFTITYWSTTTTPPDSP